MGDGFSGRSELIPTIYVDEYRVCCGGPDVVSHAIRNLDLRAIWYLI